MKITMIVIAVIIALVVIIYFGLPAVLTAMGLHPHYEGQKYDLGGRRALVITTSQGLLGVGVLFHEALQPSMIKMIRDQAGLSPSPSMAKIMTDIPSYHTSPEDAAKIAQEAGVKHLVLYHILPPLPAVLNGMFLGDSSKYYPGPITIGEDGMLFSLPVNNDKIHVRNLLK